LMILSLASRSDNVAQTTGGNFHRLSSGIVGRSLDKKTTAILCPIYCKDFVT
jgi:hypothetical protein